MNRRGIAAISARLATILIGLAIVFSVTMFPTVFPQNIVGSLPSPVTIQPKKSPVTLLCPGAFMKNVSATGADDSVALTTGLSGTHTRGLQEKSLKQKVASPQNEAERQALVTHEAQKFSTESALVTTGDPASASQSQTLNSDGVVGIVATRCESPQSVLWMPTGSGALGDTSNVQLVNSSTIPAQVTIDVFGENGRYYPENNRAILLAGESEKFVSLLAIAPDILSPVLRIHSEGGLISAFVHISSVNGITPKGVDVMSQSPPPSRRLVIPAFLISRQKTDAATGGETDSTVPILRVLTVDNAKTTLLVHIRSQERFVKDLQLDIEGGRVTDIPLADLEDGNYWFDIRSTNPVIAAVKAIVSFEGKTDFAWFSPALGITSRTAISVPSLPEPLIHVANPAEHPTEVTLETAQGKIVSFTVPKLSQISVNVDLNENYFLTAKTEVFSSMSFASPGELAGQKVGDVQNNLVPFEVFVSRERPVLNRSD